MLTLYIVKYTNLKLHLDEFYNFDESTTGINACVTSAPNKI